MWSMCTTFGLFEIQVSSGNGPLPERCSMFARMIELSPTRIGDCVTMLILNTSRFDFDDGASPAFASLMARVEVSRSCDEVGCSGERGADVGSDPAAVGPCV